MFSTSNFYVFDFEFEIFDFEFKILDFEFEISTCWGGGHIFMYSFSAQSSSFEIDWFGGL